MEKVVQIVKVNYFTAFSGQTVHQYAKVTWDQLRFYLYLEYIMSLAPVCKSNFLAHSRGNDSLLKIIVIWLKV